MFDALHYLRYELAFYSQLTFPFFFFFSKSFSLKAIAWNCGKGQTQQPSYFKRSKCFSASYYKNPWIFFLFCFASSCPQSLSEEMDFPPGTCSVAPTAPLQGFWHFLQLLKCTKLLPTHWFLFPLHHLTPSHPFISIQASLSQGIFASISHQVWSTGPTLSFLCTQLRTLLFIALNKIVIKQAIM